jgi:hypothetical protein
MLQPSMRTSLHIILVRAKAQTASTITPLRLITRTQVRTWNELRMVKRVSTMLRLSQALAFLRRVMPDTNYISRLL